jgi:hypothetical protein
MKVRGNLKNPLSPINHAQSVLQIKEREPRSVRASMGGSDITPSGNGNGLNEKADLTFAPSKTAFMIVEERSRS